MNQQDKLIKDIVRAVLTNADKFEWTLQGFGMLRLYLPGSNVRMCVWDKEAQVEGVSLMHTHPWHFESYVVCGAIYNYRYVEGMYHPNAKPYNRSAIKAGEGGGVIGAAEQVMLVRSHHPEVVAPGHFYKQRAEEIHHTDYEDGTVTLCDRTLADTRNKDFALTYWPVGSEWGSAEPRPATAKEIKRITNKALEILQ